jgi:hypothetical protein
MAAPKKNKNASKDINELNTLIRAYIVHRSEGYSKESFVDCDYRTIESHMEDNIDLQPLKKELEKADREGLKYWEEIGRQITTGALKGNPATWIFTMKNKFPDNWKDKTETDHAITFTEPITGIKITKDE